MKTLITSGCSYTSYNYKTWADYLGDNFDKSINYGLPGSGPRYSFNKIFDFLKFSYNRDNEYTIIIQWSSLIRVDYRLNKKSLLSSDTEWSAGGQINNNSNFNKEYINKYFNVVDRAADLLQYIEHLTLLSKEYNFKLYMLYMLEPWADKLLGEPCYIGQLTKFYTSFRSSKYFNELKKLYNTDFFISPSIEKFCLENEERDFNVDLHPTTKQHEKYANMILKRYL